MRRRPLTTIDAPANGWRTIRRVAPYLWPAGEPWVKRRVVLALMALFVAKLVAVGTPYFYKLAVDALSGEGAQPAWMLGAGAVGLTVAYGLARLMNVGFQQLRDVIFARVAQRALRALALETFHHIHRLSLRYHISRQDRRAEPDHGARREGGGVPAALPALFHRAADAGTG